VQLATAYAHVHKEAHTRHTSQQDEAVDRRCHESLSKAARGFAEHSVRKRLLPDAARMLRPP
jgi:hypothetical protein